MKKVPVFRQSVRNRQLAEGWMVSTKKDRGSSLSFFIGGLSRKLPLSAPKLVHRTTL